MITHASICYFVFSKPLGSWKIGRSTSIYGRMTSILQHCRGELAAAFWERVWSEKEAHQQFQHLREEYEWFSDSPEIRDALLARRDDNIIRAPISELAKIRDAHQKLIPPRPRPQTSRAPEARVEEPLIYGPRALSEKLGGRISPRTLARWAREGKIPCGRIADSRFFQMSVVMESLAKIGMMDRVAGLQSKNQHS